MLSKHGNFISDQNLYVTAVNYINGVNSVAADQNWNKTNVVAVSMAFLLLMFYEMVLFLYVILRFSNPYPMNHLK